MLQLPSVVCGRVIEYLALAAYPEAGGGQGTQLQARVSIGNYAITQPNASASGRGAVADMMSASHIAVVGTVL